MLYGSGTQPQAEPEPTRSRRSPNNNHKSYTYKYSPAYSINGDQRMALSGVLGEQAACDKRHVLIT